MSKTQVLKSPAPSTKEIRVDEGLAAVEVSVRNYAETRAQLAQDMMLYQQALEAVHEEHFPVIKGRAADLATAHATLSKVIKDNRKSFDKPRTRVFHLVKVGFGKLPGSVKFDDAARTVELIRKHLSDQFDVLVKTTHKLVKGAIQNLPGDDLAKIGATLGATGDRVIIKPAEGDVEKIVKALLAPKKKGK